MDRSAIAAGVSTASVLGAVFVPSAAVGAGLGALGGAGRNLAQQLDAGASFGDLDWGQAAGAGLVGGITGSLMGTAFAGAAATVPGFCSVAQVAGAGFTAMGAHSAHQNFQAGNNWTAAFDTVGSLAGLGAVRKGLFARMSKAVGGSCFVAGTQVVLYIVPAEMGSSFDAAAALPMSDRRQTSAAYLLVGAGLAAAGLVVARPDEKKRREEDAREIRQLLFRRQNDRPDEPWDVDRFGDDLPLGSANDENWPDRIDRLCEALFNGEEEPVDTLTPDPDDVDALPRRGVRRELSHTPDATAVLTPRHKPKQRLQPVDKSAKSRNSMPRWRKIIAAVCLLAGGLLLFRGLPSFSEPDIPPSSPGLAANAPAEARYVTTDIEKVRVGDMILAMDPETGESQPRRVVDAFHRTVHQLRVLTIRGPDGQELPPIRTTDEHPFWVHEFEDFLAAEDLEIGDGLLGPGGEISTLVASHIEDHPDGVTVYNFEVEGAHTYFVVAGEEDTLRVSPVLVHNAKAGICRLSRTIKKPKGAHNKKGSYTIKFKSGKRYHGKGTWARARASARRIIKRQGKKGIDEDVVDAGIDWKAARGNTDKQAFMDEAVRIRADGGVGEKYGNYNVINSPGKKDLPQPP